MFDINSEILLNVFTTGDRKQIVIRYPTDGEWIRWRRAKKIIQRVVGSGFEVEPPKAESADLALLNAIKLDKTPASRAEAFQIVDRLARFEVVGDPARIGVFYRIETRVMGNLTTSHTLRIPDVQEITECHRKSMMLVLSESGRRHTITLEFTAGEALYNRLVQRTEGYVHGVPIVHKAETANVLVQLIRRESGGLNC